MESACVLREASGANFHYVTLDGRPQDLRALAEYLRLVEGPISLAGEIGASIVIRHTNDELLRISKSGALLTVEGAAGTVSRLFIDALDAVADDEEAADGSGVPRHQHIEYLGEGDKWRAPDTLPLIIGSIRSEVPD